MAAAGAVIQLGGKAELTGRVLIDDVVVIDAGLAKAVCAQSRARIRGGTTQHDKTSTAQSDRTGWPP